MPRVVKKKTATKTTATFQPIFYDEPPAPLRAPKEAAVSPPVAAPRPGWKHGALLALVFLLLIMTAVAGYLYWQSRNTPTAAEQREIDALVETVSALVELPAGEIPTVATVTNKERLDDQPFFRRAENGDKILIYEQSGRAFLYRPSAERLIDITAVNIEKVDTPVPPEAPVAEPEPVPEATLPAVSEGAAALDTLPAGTRIALYNGSRKVGVTNTVEETIKGQFPQVEVSLKEKAAKDDYTGFQIIDIRGDFGAAAAFLAEALAGTVIPLPAEETVNSETSDLLVIVGNAE
jgi:hypothetical protein